MLDIHSIRKQFPILQQEVNGFPLVYFDNAATSQKPKHVIDALMGYYTGYNSNVHRGAHHLADKATVKYEETREAVRQFVGAGCIEEVIFTKGTTEAINLVAATFGRSQIKAGDEIIISTMEHHSNIVPWQMLCEEKGAKLRIIPMNEDGDLIYEEYDKMVNEKTKLVAIVHVSNVLGTINDIDHITRKAHEVGAKVLVDGAQSSPHFPVDVQQMDCDFYVFSSHKVYGPTGMGVLYGKKAILEEMPPFLGGGEMISEVTFEKTTYNDLPFKFEAGTPNIGDTIALKTALDFVNEIGKEAIAQHEDDLLRYGTEVFESIEGMNIIGKAKNKVSVISFNLEGVHPYDVGMMLDALGIAIRTGHHCAQPIMDYYQIPGTLRASISFYNNESDIDRLVSGIEYTKEFFG